MQALVFDLSLPRAGVLKALGGFRPRLFYDSPFSLISIKEVPEPALPGPEWMRIRTRACGFCGSDLNLIFLRESMTASPFSTFPAVMGHEMFGQVMEVGSGVKNVKPGDRVAVSPVLDCRVREIDPVCPACEKGLVNACENYAEGRFAPGMFTGVCRDLPGGFAPEFVAHQSQVFAIPEAVSDEAAVLTEPFAVALSAVMDNLPRDDEKVLVIGGGVIGTMVTRAIRALGSGCDLTVAEPAPFAGEVVQRSGADRLISDGDIIGNAARITGAKSYKPMMGKNILMGGFHRIFDTVGHKETLNASLRCLAADGTLTVVGIGDAVSLDFTALWLKHQTMRGTLAYGWRETDGKPTHVFETALDLAAQGRARLDDLLTHRFALPDYKQMIEVNLAKNANKAMKTAVWFG